MRGNPAKDLMFFPGKPFDPPLAGTTARSRGGISGIAQHLAPGAGGPNSRGITYRQCTNTIFQSGKPFVGSYGRTNKGAILGLQKCVPILTACTNFGLAGRRMSRYSLLNSIPFQRSDLTKSGHPAARGTREVVQTNRNKHTCRTLPDQMCLCFGAYSEPGAVIEIRLDMLGPAKHPTAIIDFVDEVSQHAALVRACGIALLVGPVRPPFRKIRLAFDSDGVESADERKQRPKGIERFRKAKDATDESSAAKCRNSTLQPSGLCCISGQRLFDKDIHSAFHRFDSIRNVPVRIRCDDTGRGTFGTSFGDGRCCHETLGDKFCRSRFPQRHCDGLDIRNLSEHAQMTTTNAPGANDSNQE